MYYDGWLNDDKTKKHLYKKHLEHKRKVREAEELKNSLLLSLYRKKLKGVNQ
jgi:hypothetical protein